MDFGGRYTLTLTANRYATVNPLHEHHGGRLERAGDRLYFTDTECVDEPGVYRWKATATTLRLEAVKPDGCQSREVLLTYPRKPWRRR